jgi:hypothetical protein
MTSEKLAWHRENGRLLDPKFDRLAQIGDRKKEQEKKLSIKYLSDSTDDKYINIKFSIETPKIKSSTATVFIQEMNAKNEEAKTTIATGLKSNSYQSITVSFDKNKEFDKYPWQDDYSFQATITIDSLSAKSEEFVLKREKKNEEKEEKCLCKKSSWTADDLKNIVTQLRKLDAIMEQAQYNGKDPYYIDKDGKLHLGINKADAQKLKYKKYKKKTSFYDRNDNVDGKPLKDRIFFYDSDKDDDNVNYNLNKEYANYETFAKQLNKVFVDYKITKCIQKIHFLAQVYVETNRFRSTYEDKPKSTYSGGEFYRGRGMKQITHDYNYLNYYDERKGKGKNLFKLYIDNRETYYKKNGKVDSYESVVHFKSRTENEFISYDEMSKFEDFVKLLSISIYWACDSAGWYWNKTKLNKFANDDENAIIVVSAKVNNPSASENPTGTGINGLDDRKKYFELLKQIFDYENCK